MKASGNGTPEVCANNLLRIVRGEVPYDRVKGIAPWLIDRPLSSALVEIEQDAEQIIGIYEPRVTFDGLTIERSEAADGSIVITANITETEE